MIYTRKLLEAFSRIEAIGRGLYVDSWQAQIARNLKNQDGESISRKTVQSWQKHDNLPAWALLQLSKIAEERLKSITTTLELINSQK